MLHMLLQPSHEEGALQQLLMLPTTPNSLNTASTMENWRRQISNPVGLVLEIQNCENTTNVSGAEFTLTLGKAFQAIECLQQGATQTNRRPTQQSSKANSGKGGKCSCHESIIM